MNKFKKPFLKKIKLQYVYVAVALFVIISIGLYLRIGGVLNNSFAFTYDVGRDMLKVADITRGDVPLIGQTTGLGGLFYGPWWYYILTVPFVISQGNPQGVALFMVIIGISTILVGFYLGKKISGIILGLIIAVLISFSDTMVGLSSQIWNPNIAPLLVLLCFILLIPVGLKKVSLLVNFVLGFLLGLLFDSEIVFGLFFFCGFVLSYVFVFSMRIFTLQVLSIILGFVLVFLPRVLFEFRHGFVMTRSLFNISGEQQVLDVKNFFTVLPDRLSVFAGMLGETFGLNMWGGVTIAIMTLGGFILLQKKGNIYEKRFFILTVIIIGIFIVGSSFFARAIWGHYLVGIPVIYIVSVSIIVSLIFKKNLYLGFFICILLAFLSLKPQQVLSNIQNPNWEGDAAVYRNQVAVLDYIYQDANGKQFNYIAYSPAVHDYPYQYLFAWYGKKHYGYSPAVDTQEFLYVILEPDPGYEGRLLDWLKIREGDGNIIFEKEIKGGIKVQKRMR